MATYPPNPGLRNDAWYANPGDASLRVRRGRRLTPEEEEAQRQKELPPGLPLNELPPEAAQQANSPLEQTPKPSLTAAQIQNAVGFIDESQITPSIVLKRGEGVPLTTNYNFGATQAQAGAPISSPGSFAGYSGSIGKPGEATNPFLQQAIANSTPQPVIDDVNKQIKERFPNGIPKDFKGTLLSGKSTGGGTTTVDTETTVKQKPKKPSTGAALGTIAGGIGGAYAAKEGLGSIADYLGGLFGGGTSALSGLGGAEGASEILSSIYSGGPANYVEALPTYGVEAGAATGSVASSILGPVAGIAGAIGAYDLLNRDNVKPGAGALQGAASGAGIGTFILPGPGTAIGAGIGGLVGLAKGLSGSSKGEAQMKRDSIREFLEQTKFAERNEEGHHVVTLADGSKYDIGDDGPTAVSNFSGEGTHRPYDVDTSNPLSEKAVANLNPLAEIVTGGDDKLRSDFAGYFANAAGSNAKDEGTLKANALTMYERAGFNQETAKAAIMKLKEAGSVTEQEAQVYMHDIDVLYGGGETPRKEASTGSRRKQTEGGEKNASRRPRGKKKKPELNTPSEVPTYGANQQQIIQVLNEINRRNQGLA